jgi:ATP-dependent DNA helicase 2 subunit 2
LASPGFYEHVKVVRPITSPDVALLKLLQDVRPEGANSDFIDALIVGIDLLSMVEPKKGVATNMRLFLVTDAAGEVNASDLEQIINKMVELRISLNVVGVDFAEEDSTHESKKSEASSSQAPQVKDPPSSQDTKIAVKVEDEDQITIKAEPSSQLKATSSSQASSSTPSSSQVGVKSETQSSSTNGTGGKASVALPSTRQIRKRRNENVLKLICSRVHGAIVPVREALDLMNYFASKSVTSHPNYRGFLEIGTSIKIPVWSYLKTKEETMPRLVSISKLSSEAMAAPSAASTSSTSTNTETKVGEAMDITKPDSVVEPTLERTMGVAMQKTYVSMDNPDEEIPYEQQVRGYKYGKTYVPAANSIVPYTSVPGMKLIGFTAESSVPRHFYTSNAEVIVPYSKDDAAAQAISALCHAMVRTGMVGIVRVVKRKNSGPMLGVISPHISDTTETLYLNRLPFNDDLRMYGFLSLIESEDGLTQPPKHAIPSEKQLNVTEDFINSLDLSDAAISAFGEPMEALKPKHTFNPSLQYFYQVISSRALKPNLPVPALDPSILGQVSLDEEKRSQAAAPVARFHEAFTLTKTENKEKENRRRFWSEAFGNEGEEADKLESYLGEDSKKQKKKDEPLPAGLNNIQALLRGGVDAVGNLTPVEDFQAMMARRDVDLVDKAIEEIQVQSLRLVNDSFKNSHYDKAIECIIVLRAGCIKEQESEQFNKFMETMKTTFKGGLRNDFWSLLQEKNINLISSSESDDSNVTPEEARDFYATEATSTEATVDDGTKQSEKTSMGAAEELFDLM